MGNNLDKNKICDSIRKSKPNELLYLTVNSVDKNSLKSVLSQIERFCGKDDVEVVVVRK